MKADKENAEPENTIIFVDADHSYFDGQNGAQLRNSIVKGTLQNVPRFCNAAKK